MNECPEFHQIERAIEDGADPSHSPELAAHLQDCQLCRGQLARMNWLALLMGEMEVERIPSGEEHLTDAEMTAFVVHAHSGEPALRIETHVSGCDECLTVVAAVRKRLDETEEVFGHANDAEHTEAPIWLRRLFLAGAAACYLIHVGLLGLMLASGAAWWVLGRGLDGQFPGWWPFSLLLPGPARLVLLMLTCAVLTAPARWLAGLLHRRAMGDAKST